MEILKLANVYKNWALGNSGASQMDKLIARSLLATNDVSSTLFITEASFEDISRIYSTLDQGSQTNHVVAHPIDNDMQTGNREEQLTEKDDEDSNTKKRLDRKKVVGYVMSSIVKGNEGAKVIKVRYNTMEVQLANSQLVKVKVSTSRDYHDPLKLCCSWHKEDDKHITEYDYHVYVVEWGTSYKSLIFTTNELQNHLKQKTYNDHFVNYYFHWHSNGSVTDERDTTTPIEITRFDADKIKWQLK